MRTTGPLGRGGAGRVGGEVSGGERVIAKMCSRLGQEEGGSVMDVSEECEGTKVVHWYIWVRFWFRPEGVS
jgi:hypothetical protein